MGLGFSLARIWNFAPRESPSFWLVKFQLCRNTRQVQLSIPSRSTAFCAGIVLLSTALCSVKAEPQGNVHAPAVAGSVVPVAADGAVQTLFDGRELGGWKRTEFSGGGEVRVEDGVLLVEPGEELSGIQWTKPVPFVNYEFEVEAHRRSGLDFFCGLTFPVGTTHLSLILGGWGGGTVGISSIDGQDASRNETTFFRTFDDFRWYKVRVRVEAGRVRVWLDGASIVDLETRGKSLGLRAGEIEMSRPLGLATFRTGAAFRGMTLRKLAGSEGK